MNTRNYFKSTALAIALCAALPAVADETTVTTVENVKHHYVYYRDHDVYFAPETKTYYWYEDGKWKEGAALPRDVQQFASTGGVDVELDTARPYERNDYVVAHYKTAPMTTRETSTSTSADGSTTTTTTTTKHRYVYYSDHDIFYAPDTKMYYWRSNGNWTSGATVPAEDQAFVRKGVTIELDTDKPYERHDYVISHYKTRQDDDHQ